MEEIIEEIIEEGQLPAFAERDRLAQGSLSSESLEHVEIGQNMLEKTSQTTQGLLQFPKLDVLIPKANGTLGKGDHKLGVGMIESDQKLEIPTQEMLQEESASLPSGWVVCWSKRMMRRYWCRLPSTGLPELKQWAPPASTSRSKTPSSPTFAPHDYIPSTPSSPAPGKQLTSPYPATSPPGKPGGRSPEKRQNGNGNGKKRRNGGLGFAKIEEDDDDEKDPDRGYKKKQKVSFTREEQEAMHKKKYEEILAVSQTILATNVYGGDAIAEKKDDFKILDLPLPPHITHMEERPELHVERKQACERLEGCLKNLCKQNGIRKEPPDAFKRWQFCQSVLQGPLAPHLDPLIPIRPCIPMGSGLCHELVKEGLQLQKAVVVCRVLSQFASEEAKRLIEIRKKHSSKDGAPIPPCVIEPPQGGSVRVLYDPDGMAPWGIPLNEWHYQKVKRLYEDHTGKIDSSNAHLFARRLWCMLARYDTIGGAGYQAAIPEACFQLLQERFGVEHECFASPLNQFMPSFGSAFPDTDHFFGSKGSFFDLRAEEGSFEANPPFLEEHMAAMAFHVLALLERSQAKGKALCFVVIWPGWDDTPAFDILNKSPFNRKLIRFEKLDHCYKDGFQHRSAVVYRRSAAKSMVFFMQTDAGSKKWPCNEENIKLFEEVFRQER